MKHEFFIGVMVGLLIEFFLLQHFGGVEHHTKPYTIAYETITVQDKIDCLQDPNCNDIILWSDLPQRPEGK